MSQNISVNVLISLVFLLNIAACTTTPQPVEVPAPGPIPPTTEVFVGAQVQVVKMDHALIRFKVLEITPTGLRGKDGVVPYQDMRSLTLLRPNSDSVVLALGIAAAVGGIILASQTFDLSPIRFEPKPDN
jgi:hypothetical protein